MFPKSTKEWMEVGGFILLVIIALAIYNAGVKPIVNPMLPATNKL